MTEKYYPDSKVELQGFIAKHYDQILSTASLGIYGGFIKKAIKAMNIQQNDKILDIGAGTGKNALLMNKYLNSSGKVLGLEISDLMIGQFRNKTKNNDNLEIQNKRIDKPLNLEEKFSKVFISFVFHGFPYEIQQNIIENAYNSLEDGGEFVILDFNEFELEKTPFYFRVPFKIIECKYAFEYVERDWKSILKEKGFSFKYEKLFMKKYIRLLVLKKEKISE